MPLDDPDDVRGFSPTDALRVARAVRWVEKQETLKEKNRAHVGGAEPQGPIVYNDSGEVIPPFAVMKHDSGVTDTATNDAWIKVKKPDTTFARYLVNGPEEIAIGGLGRAQDCRYGSLKYDTGTPVKYEGYGPKPGQWTASKGYPCLGICQEIEYADAKYMQVEFLPITTLLGKTTGSISAGASTTSYKIYAGTLGSEADAGWTTVPSVWFRAALGSGKWMKATWINNGWEGEPLEC